MASGETVDGQESVSEDIRKLCERTEPDMVQYLTGSDRLRSHKMMQLLHAAMGICTEAGELMDAMKKHVFYGKPLDTVNVAEELGDVGWYIMIAVSAIRKDHPEETFDTIMYRVINKLKKRYPEKFTEQNALKRNLDAERKVLES